MKITSTKFICLLKTLDETELKSFELFLQSPWCNTNRNTLQLLEKIKNYHPDFDTPKMDKGKLFKRILPNGKFSDRRMNNILSDAFLALEEFVAMQSFREDKAVRQTRLIQGYQKRQLETAFFKTSQQVITRLENKPVKEWEDHLELLRLQRRIYHHPNQRLQLQPGEQTIVKMGEELKLVYLLEQAVIINEKIARSRILKNEKHEIEKELKLWRLATEGVENTTLEFYKMRFDYTEENRLEQYFRIREAFLKKYEELNEKEQKVHLISLLNDTTLIVKMGLIDIIEFLPLYKLGLKTKIIIQNEVLSYNTFVSIVAINNTTKDFAFTEQFIENYISKEHEINKLHN